MRAVDFSVCEGYLDWFGLINLHPPVAEPRFKPIEVSLEGMGSDVVIFVTGYNNSIRRKSGKDGVLSSWYVSSEEQMEEMAEYASLGYAWINWEIWGCFRMEFYLGVTVWEVGLEQEVVRGGE
jgi:hypothetical protein